MTFDTSKPGLELSTAIWHAYSREDRPGWPIGPHPEDDALQVVAPRPALALNDERKIVPLPSRPLPEDHIPARLALFLEAEGEAASLAQHQLQAHDRRVGKRLYAAALRDICGLSFAAIEEVCCYGTENSALKRVQEARPVWRALGFWPWAMSPPGNPWNGRSELLTESLEAWLTTHLNLSSLSDAHRATFAEAA